MQGSQCHPTEYRDGAPCVNCRGYHDGHLVFHKTTAGDFQCCVPHWCNEGSMILVTMVTVGPTKHRALPSVTARNSRELPHVNGKYTCPRGHVKDNFCRSFKKGGNYIHLALSNELIMYKNF